MEEKTQNNKFLGTEKIGKLLKMFAIPCVLSLVIQALYNIVDQIFIGHSESLGSLGNTATGIIYPLTVIALAFGLLLGDGASSSISISQGRNDSKNIHKTIGTCLTSGLIISILLVAICFIFKNQIIVGFGATGEIIDFASEYANWIIAGFPLYILGTIMNPIVRADGSPKYAMFAMMLGAVVNIILDPIFIFACDWGMTGAALATFIGQLVTFILHFIYFFKPKCFKLSIKSFLVDFKLLTFCLKLGISSFLTQVAIVIVSIMNNIILATYLSNDTSAIGLLTIAFKVFGIVISVAIGISAGAQPILGYNYGAKKNDRVKDTLKYVLIITTIVGVVSTLLFELIPEQLFAIFGYQSVSTFGINTFRIYLSCILLTCLTKAISIFFQAIGSPIKSILIALFRDVVFLVPLSIILPLLGGIDLFLWSAPISDIITTIICVVLVVLFLKNLSKEQIKSKDSEKLSLVLPTKKGVIVTIAREHGAGGREIGKALAEKLKIPFYDKEVTAFVAKETGLAKDYIDNIGDNVSSLFYDMYLSTQANQDAMIAQENILKKIADNGSCVIVGRSADYVLRDYYICRIFIYAKKDFKVQRIMMNYNDNEQEALQNCEKSDKKRALYYKSISGLDWGNKENYDICLDSSIGIDNAVNILYEYIKNNYIK